MKNNMSSKDKIIEVGTTPEGYTVFRVWNEGDGAWEYVSDSVAPGYVVVKTVTKISELELIIADMKRK